MHGQERIAGARPEAISLTHGRSDHVGSVRALAERWDVPVYAHPHELPFLTGQSTYLPSDPTVGGADGLSYPHSPSGRAGQPGGPRPTVA